MKKLNPQLYYLAPILMMGFIFFLSHQAGGVHELPDWPGLDKVLHFLIYALLSAAWLLATQKNNWHYSFSLSFGFSVAYGLFDEFHQLYVPGRCFELLDWGADSLGALFLILIYRHFQSIPRS
jgi:VanZ family protein